MIDGYMQVYMAYVDGILSFNRTKNAQLCTISYSLFLFLLSFSR